MVGCGSGVIFRSNKGILHCITATVNPFGSLILHNPLRSLTGAWVGRECRLSALRLSLASAVENEGSTVMLARKVTDAPSHWRNVHAHGDKLPS